MSLSARILDRVTVVPDHGGFGLDFTAVFADADMFEEITRNIIISTFGKPFDTVAGIDAMGLPFAMAVAYQIKLPFFPIRRANQAVGETIIGEENVTEKSTVKFAVSPAIKSRRVLVIDDTISTGITMSAAVNAIRNAGATVSAVAVVLNMPWALKPCAAGIPFVTVCSLDALSLPANQIG